VTAIIPTDTLKVEESIHSKVVKGRKDVRWTGGLFNLRSRHTMPLRDMRVRKALNYAVNKEELYRYAFKGTAVEMKGMLTRNADVDLSDTAAYDWDVPKARRLLKEAGYGEGFKMKMYYQEKDYLIAYLLRRFYNLLNIDVDISPVHYEWAVKHLSYPNTREGYSWNEEDWWIFIISDSAYAPEPMGHFLEVFYQAEGAWRVAPAWLTERLEIMHDEVRETMGRERRFEIYKRANDYIADQAFLVTTMAPLAIYGVNEELNFVPQVSQYLYLDYSSVTDKHWSLVGNDN
jgi:ABC-type transport system substrate-binding protein